MNCLREGLCRFNRWCGWGVYRHRGGGGPCDRGASGGRSLCSTRWSRQRGCRMPTTFYGCAYQIASPLRLSSWWTQPTFWIDQWLPRQVSWFFVDLESAGRQLPTPRGVCARPIL